MSTETAVDGTDSIQSRAERTLEDEANALIEKQNEFRAKIIAERAALLLRIAELNRLLAKLGANHTVKRRTSVQSEKDGGEASVPLDDEEEEQESISLALKNSDGPTTGSMPESWRPNPKLTKTDQILEIIRVKGPQTRTQITEMFPHANSAEKARTWTPMYQLTRSGRLVENRHGQLEITK
jgi:hypothetical protein